MSTAIPTANILGQRVLFGASWSAIARVTIQLSTLAASTVVARRVPPNAFGIVGMAALAVGLISLFRDLGTAAAVIQKRDLNQQLLSSLFWVNLGIGFVGRGFIDNAAHMGGLLSGAALAAVVSYKPPGQSTGQNSMSMVARSASAIPSAVAATGSCCTSSTP